MPQVTAAHDDNSGSLEYLVFSSTLEQVAALYKLRPVLHYDDPQLEECFVRADKVSDASSGGMDSFACSCSLLLLIL